MWKFSLLIVLVGFLLTHAGHLVLESVAILAIGLLLVFVGLAMFWCSLLVTLCIFSLGENE